MSSLFISALLASVAAGIPDVFVAAALSGASPGRVLQTIASGVLGEASYIGGWRSIALGLGLQIAMSFAIALTYNIAFSYVAGIRRSPLMFGALYGIVIFVVMNFVVVPLSRAYPKPQWDLKSVVAMLIVMVLFGEIISLIAAAFAERASNPW
jgi:uncharacterized membrane protein YagU involved in acid resistance